MTSDDNNKPQSYHLALLKSVLSDIPQASQHFANSLLRNGARYALSDKQLFYVKKLYNDNKTRDLSQPAAPATKPDNSYLLGHDTSKVLHMFSLAAGHLQKPKIRLYFGQTVGITEPGDDIFAKPKFKLHTTIRVCPAGPTSKYPNCLYLKPDHSDYSKWYGRIEQDGRFVPGNLPLPDGKYDLEDGPDGIRNSVSARTIILAFLCDPINISAQMGRLIGRCCYCNRHLEDERSTFKGYGPICAAHYGLPWGDDE